MTDYTTAKNWSDSSDIPQFPSCDNYLKDNKHSSDILVHGPGQQNFQFLTTLGDKGYRIFLETLFTLLYLNV